MTPERKIELLDQQIAEVDSGNPANFEQWRSETEVILRRVLGGSSHLVSQFEDIYYIPVQSGVREAVALLQAAKVDVRLESEAAEQVPEAAEASAPSTSQTVFIVHGHDSARKHEVARLVLGLTGRDPVILHEQPDIGQVLIEKFEANAARAGFAVILMTADDLGRAKGDSTDAARARQNVVFEMGYFYGSIGRARVAVLLDEGVEQVGDIVGVVYTPLDDAGGWKTKLATNMQAAGLEIDWSALGRV